MYRKMLVLLDGSRLAEVVLPYAGELAVGLGVEVTLFHVCSVQECESVPVHRDYVERIAEVARHQWLGDDRMTSAEPGRRVGVRCRLAVGHPAEEILRYASDNDIDLIVMATHGRSGIRRWALGSVADKVLSASQVPVLLVRAQVAGEAGSAAAPLKTIVVPLDGSEVAELVLPHVEMLARQLGAGSVEVVLVAVCEPLPSPLSRTASSEAGADYRAVRSMEGSESYLSRVKEQLQAAGVRVWWRVLLGKAADEIVAYANSSPSNLLAMATHGSSGRSRWVYGSVAEKVLLGATTPVLLVRPGVGA